MLLPIIALIAPAPATPVEFGQQAIAEAAGPRAGDVRVEVQQGGPKESFRIESHDGKVTITAPDQVGAMYGAFDFAERLKNEGDKAWQTNAKDQPFLPERGLNLFLTLPWNYAKNNTDFDDAALTDPNRWWFKNEDYWTTLLDLMAKSRLNWLDIHGTWDISVTNAPNLYAYFVTSPTFPNVGVPADVKADLLKQLNHVIEMAHARGIRVSLMAYEAGLKIPQNKNPGYQETESNIYNYTREVVEQMIRKAPGLDAIGFRIGESGKSESFFKCYLEAVKNSGRDIPLITRSWVTKRQNVLPLARASDDFTVEIKYNGEQWGAPYMVAGGRMASWGSYSFEDYLSDAGAQGQNAKTWPGWPAEGGGAWPSEPYKVVWQVRANGTHRIFPFYNPDWVRRSILAMKVGTVSGYTIEGDDAYYPKSQDYYLANPSDKYCDWMHQRDEMYWMTWGRLGYDPNTPDETFDTRLHDWFGSQSERIAHLWKEASEIVPLSYMAYSLGPDHRDHAPELETGGDLQSFIDNQPFDPFVFRPTNQDGLVQDGRAGRLEVASVLARIDREVREAIGTMDASAIPQASRGRFKELKNALLMLSDLGEYYASRFYGSSNVFGLERQIAPGDPTVQKSWQEATSESLDAWRKLCDTPEANFYKPFTERLRMHTNDFHWKLELPLLQKEQPNPIAYEDPFTNNAVDWATPPADLKLTWKPDGETVRCELPSQGMAGASLLYKPLPSSTFFHEVPMDRQGGRFVATVDRDRCGMCLAADVVGSQRLYRVPSFFRGERPYLIVPAQPGPTPQIYATNEALDYLDPKALSPMRYGTLLIVPRASTFFRFSRSMKRKLLDPVQRGMTMLILQQDFLSNRYPLDFLPTPLKVEASQNRNTFDPGGALGLKKVDVDGILWQRFTGSPGWEILGNGGLARLRYGKGQILVTSARLMQCIQNKDAAFDLEALLKGSGPEQALSGNDEGEPYPGPSGLAEYAAPMATRPSAFAKLSWAFGAGSEPFASSASSEGERNLKASHSTSVVLVDPGTESSVYTTSFYPDLLNSLKVPFVTLGEAIAKEQGMNSIKPVMGTQMADDVLGGKGKAMVNAFLKGEVEAMSSRPTAPSVPAFEELRKRRKKELFRMLGLDPMPKKTPLNARITGTIPGNGYHIEKLVFESRPHFYVTGHVYVPDAPHKKLPVIMNVNGHWAHKKDEDRIQLRCQFQALQGYIAIAIDSPGHSFEGDNLIERRAEGEHNDYDLVEGGTNTTGYYVWDAMRALDYMATRPDTDMSRIGITGASGGGLATLYTFAADDRYKAAVPVVYMASLETAPDNGCLCNHVPGTCQIGDRSDVIALQAPKPVLIMGAQQDGEFPADATRLTQKKMAESWALFGKADDTFVRIFPGGHDYNQGMREAMIGFFNKYLKHEGDGSPVPQPTLTAIDPENRELLALDPPASDERTMRDLSQEYLQNAPTNVSAADAIKVNGGVPARADLRYAEKDAGDNRKFVTFESEPGFVTPGVLAGAQNGDTVTIFVDDGGKKVALDANGGAPGLYLDVLGTGELSDFEMRYSVYMGKSVAFIGGWQIVRAMEAMRRYGHGFKIHAKGPISTQAAMWAALIDPSIAAVTAEDCLQSWQDVFKSGVSDYAVQPRAHLCGSLAHLRSLAKNSTWR